MQLFWKETKSILPEHNKEHINGDVTLIPGTIGFSLGSSGVMFQGFPGDFDTISRGSSSPSIESQYLSSVDSFGSPPASASQDCVSAGGGDGVGSGSGGSSGGVDMPGSFVPTVTAITSSQDLQWMVQPTLISSQASGQSGTQSVSLVDPYDLPGPSYSSGSGFTPAGSETPGQGPAPGPIRQSRTRSRRVRDESLTPEEQEKRRVRRERNKLAAAKCRNRRRELTDRLQGETDILEEEKSELEAEISELQKEKERLEFVLVAHEPSCKIPYQEQQASGSTQLQHQPLLPQQAPVSIVGLTVEDTFYLPPAYTSQPSTSQHQQQQVHPQQQVQPQQQVHPQQQVNPHPGMMQEVAFSSSFYGSSEPAPGGPCLVADGGGGGHHDGAAAGSYNPSYTSSFVFSYPEGACGVSANQRNSSSEQSSGSLNSPSLLAL